MELSKKLLAIIIIVAVSLTIVAVMAIFNIGGVGDSLAGAGGPFANGLYKVFKSPYEWALSGGWPTLAVVCLLFWVILPCSVAYAVWHYDIPYKITGAVAESPATGFGNTMQAEPQEPERAPQTAAQ